MAAGMMCITVRTACDEKVASIAAIRGGLPCDGWMKSLSLRTTMAIEIATESQNPARMIEVIKNLYAAAGDLFRD